MPTSGTLFIDSVAASIGSQFTQQDIDDNKITYSHSGDEPAAEGFSFSVDDGQGTQTAGTFTITISPVNDSATIGTNTALDVDEGEQDVIITSSHLNEADPDDAATGIDYELLSLPSYGTLKRSATALSVGDMFTQEDIDLNRITYSHNGSETTADSFNFRLSDGLEDGASTVDGAFSIYISAVNDAPVLDNFTNPGPGYDCLHMTSIPLAIRLRKSWPAWVATRSPMPMATRDGIAVRGVDDQGGQWQYSIDDGASWTAFSDVGVGSVDATQSVLLNATSKIRFVPADGFSGTAGLISFVAWDQTEGACGDTGVDSTSNGTTSAFGNQLGTAAVDVTENQLPVAQDDSLGTFDFGSATSIAVADLLANDSDPDGGTIQLLDFSQPAHGTLVDNGNGTLTYQPDNGFSGTDSFTYVTVDQHSGLTNYWNFELGGSDQIGGEDIVLHGASINDGAIHFESSQQDYARINGLSYEPEFTLSFRFQIDDNSGNGYRYMYSDGAAGTNNSLNIFFRESGSSSPTPNTLATVILDGNDTLDYYALNIDASGLTGGWHTYTLVVDDAGSKVYIDGTLEASSSHGADGPNLSGNVVLGARSDNTNNRWMEGSLDSIALLDRPLSETDIIDLLAAPSQQRGDRFVHGQHASNRCQRQF